MDGQVFITQGDITRLYADAVRSKPGTGLGLAICAQIAEAHGGGLSADSELGKGSTFQLTLPAQPVPF